MEMNLENFVNVLNDYFSDIYRSFPPSLDYIVTFGLATILAMKYIFLDSNLDPKMPAGTKSEKTPGVVETCDGTEPITQSEMVVNSPQERKLRGNTSKSIHVFVNFVIQWIYESQI